MHEVERVKIGGRPEALGTRIGKGGEGEVYALPSRPDRAVKIYKKTLRSQREPKVRAMVAGQLAGTTDLVSFPAEIVTDLRGGFVGFIMRLVSGYQPIHELYSPKSRKQHFPKADYRFLVRAALNVARAVGKVHRAGCVIGDLNHSGVLVAHDATVSLIDADSFQFVREGRYYPCVVGVPDFTPPELHGINLASVTRTRAHDHFGLAVAIFHLLAMGKHPYAGRFSGGDLSMGEAIAQNRFAFSLARKNETLTTPPPGSVSLQDFPISIAHAFEMAFGLDPAIRPDATQWVSVLKELEAALSHCTEIKTHYFPSAAGKCAWCRLAGQSGVDMFPDLLRAAPPMPGGSFDIEHIWIQIQGVRLPRPEDVLPTWSGDTGSGSSAVVKAKRALKARKALGFAALIGAALGFGYAAGAAIIWLGLSVFGLVKLLGGSVDQEPFKIAYRDADQRARSAELAFLKRMGLTELAGIRENLERSVAEYRKLDGELAHEIMRLKSTREARQRASFLDRFAIRRARISGIGPGKTATLASFGIETAADITKRAVMAVPGFGEALSAKLMLWRRGHEAKFRYNPAPDPSDVQTENGVRAANSAKRADLQSKIRSGATALQAAPQRLTSCSQSTDQALMHALGERARAAQDLKILGIAVPPAAPIVLGAKPQPTPAPAASAPRTTPKTTSGSVPSCPRCGTPMRRRTARRGARAGHQFWGCSRYPSCTGTRN